MVMALDLAHLAKINGAWLYKFNRAWLCKELKNITSNVKLAQRAEHQTRLADVPNSVLTGDNFFAGIFLPSLV